MSDVANLNIVIGANVSQATQGLETVSQGLAKTAVAAGKVDSTFLKSTQSTNTAAFALQNLGRVAQDAPFGFIAIQNNLNPLLESFQRLKAESGSTSGALKALAGTLTGPAGVGIALSVISSALVLYSQHAQQAKKTTNDFLDAIAESSAALNTELTKMSALVQVVRDSAESQEVRNNALKELQKIYPGYLNNLSLDNANTKVGIELVNALADALERKSKVQAYANLLTKSQEDLIKAQNGDLRDNLSFLDKVAAALKSGGNASLFVSGAAGTAAKNQADAIDLLQKKISEYSKVLSDLTQEQVKSGDFIFPDPKKARASADGVREVAEAFKTIQNNQLAIIDNNQKIALAFAIPKEKATPFSFGDLGQPKAIDEMNRQLKASAEIVETVQGAFDNLFESIANGSNVFAAVANSIKALIVKLIAAVIEAALLSLVLNSIFPGLGSTGAFNFGKLLGQLAGLPKFAAGGVVTQPTLALVGESGPERITPLNQLTGAAGNAVQVTGEFVQHGRDLRAVVRLADKSANTFQ